MRKIIVVSAVNLSEGGPLTVIKSVLDFLDNSDFAKSYRIISFVHSKELFNDLRNVELIEYPKIKNSWLNRIKFEYYDCMKISKEIKPDLWLSLHDITPNVISKKRAVYCHNASPFYIQKSSDFFDNPLRFLYTKFYKYLYRINIHKNDYVIVQQKWIKDAFTSLFNLNKENVIVALPNENNHNISVKNVIKEKDSTIFFYPAFPRSFKNFEIICKAVEKLNEKGIINFKVKLTINGSENKYSEKIVKEFSKYKQIEFIGLLSKKEVEDTYSITDCLIFPSKLETWGLPISEFKNYKKPMLVANLPYAYETVGAYNKVKYFNITDSNELAEYMQGVIQDTIIYYNSNEVFYEKPIAKNWDELFKILLQ